MKPCREPRERAIRIPLLAALVAAAVLLISSCTAPRPDVTFFGNRTAVTAAPALWCAVDTAALTLKCPPTDPAGERHLAMRPGQPLQINLPAEVAKAPWLVAFRYREGSGKEAEGRSAVFSDGRLAYTLPPVSGSSQLLRVEVQSGLLPTRSASGVSGFAVSRSWVLVVNPSAPRPPA